MRRVLVTGGAGFLGSALVAALAERGDEVHALVHPRTDAWRLARAGADVRVHRVDLVDQERLRAVVAEVAAEFVFHTAARAGHPEDAESVMLAWRDTVLGTVSLVEALRGVGAARLVHVGSSTEYEPSPHPLQEDGPLRPSTVRGAAKLAAAVAVIQGAAALAVPLTVLRPFAVYGPYEMEGRLVPTVMSCLRSGTPFRMTAHTSRRDFVYVDDVVDACLVASESPAAAGGVFNVGTGVESSVREVVETAQAVTGRRLRLDPTPYPARAVDRTNWVADMTHTAAVLGWKPAVDLAEGLRRTFAAHDPASRS